MFSLLEVLNFSCFEGAVVIAGEAGLNGEVKDLSVMEVPDIEEYVKEGEFLLSTLYPFAGKNEQLNQFIPRLKSLGLSGIGIKLNRYFKEIPDICIQQANELGFPIVLLPGTSNFSFQINGFLKEEIRKQNVELEHRNVIHDTLMDILVKGDDIESLAVTLGNMLHKNVVLYHKNFELLSRFPSNEEEENPIEHWIEKLQEQHTKQHMWEWCEKENYAFYRIGISKETIGYILIYGSTSLELTAIERITIQQFALVFRIMLQQKAMMESIVQRNRENFAYDLIYGEVKNESAAVARARVLNWRLVLPVQIFLIHIPEMEDAKERQNALEYLQKKIQTKFFGSVRRDDCFWIDNRTYFVLFQNGKVMEKANEFGMVCKEALKELGIEHSFMSLSRSAKSISDLPESYREAEYAMEIAKQIHFEGVMPFKNLGIYRIIYGSENTEELKHFCEDTIGPLIRYDKEHKSDLVHTLEYIIDHNHNLKDAAKDLFVHYNTVRYRYRLMEELLGKSLEDAATFQDLWLAVKIYQIMKGTK